MVGNAASEASSSEPGSTCCSRLRCQGEAVWAVRTRRRSWAPRCAASRADGQSSRPISSPAAAIASRTWRRRSSSYPVMAPSCGLCHEQTRRGLAGSGGELRVLVRVFRVRPLLAGEPEFGGAGDELQLGADAELGVDPGQVAFDGALADE